MFKPGDLVQPSKLGPKDTGLEDIVGVVTVEPPLACQWDNEATYHVVWLADRAPKYSACGCGKGYIHVSGLKLFV